MAVGLLAKKLGMTRVFLETGLAVPVTLLNVGPCTIIQIKNMSSDGYSALQIGYGAVQERSLTQPVLGHFKKSLIQPLRYLKEFRIPEDSLGDFKVGQVLDSTLFADGDILRITGNSVGKGFSGCQKRHNFTIGPMSHGSKNHRAPGSIGAGSTPGRVYPGKKMAGRLGNSQVTLPASKIVYIDKERSIIAVKGCVPGKKGSLVRLSKKA
jgi:large subunit ribosomal protein L3